MINLNDYLGIDGFVARESRDNERTDFIGQGKIVYVQEGEKRQHYLYLNNESELIPLVEGSFDINKDEGSRETTFTLTLKSKIGAQKLNGY